MIEIVSARHSLLLALSSAILVSGCATVEPYLDPYATKHPDPPVSVKRDLPQVTAAVDVLDTWGKSAHAKRAEVTKTRRGLDGLTFALGAGAVAAPLYKAHHDVMTTMLLGAGTAYSANALFNPSDLSQLYGSASAAFSCIADKGRAIQGAYAAAPTLDALDAQEVEVGGSFRACRTSNAAAVHRFQNALSELRGAISRVKQSDYAASNKLTRAGQNVVAALNTEVDKRTPSSEAVLLAARSVGSVGTIGAPAATAPERAAGLGGMRQCTDAEVQKLDSLSHAYEKQTKALDAALNSIADLDSACTLNVAAVADFGVSQEAVVLAPGASINLVISGGRAPYTYSWESDPAANAVSASHFMPSVIAVRAGSAAKGGGPYKLVIRDSSAVGNTKTVSVTVSAAS